MVESSAKVLGAFLGTLYLNVYQTDTNFQVVKKKLPDELKLELQQLNAHVGAELASAYRAAACTWALTLPSRDERSQQNAPWTASFGVGFALAANTVIVDET